MKSTPKGFLKLEKITDKITATALEIAAYATIGIALLVVIEILVRKLFTLTTYVAGEFTEYGLAIVILFGTADLIKRRQHLSVDVITARMPQKLKNIAELGFSLMLFLIYSIILTYLCFQLMKQSFDFKIVAVTFSRTPLWIPQSMMVLGLLSLDLACIMEIIKWFLVNRSPNELTS